MNIILWTTVCMAAAVAATTNFELQQRLDALEAQYHRHLQTDHSGHNMGTDDGTDHSGGHADESMAGTDHSGGHADGSMAGTDHSGGHTDNHSGHGVDSVGHGIFFTTGNEATVLFESWTTDSWGEYIGTCIFVIFLGVLLEAITTFRMMYPMRGGVSTFKAMRTPANGASTDEVAPLKASPLTWSQHIVKTLLYMFGVTIAYCIMLIIMTFNVGLFISAVLGLTIGFFTFGMARSRVSGNENDSSECCHNIA